MSRDTNPTTSIPANAVVVGIDGSERDATCLAYAAGAATRAGCPLHLLHAQELVTELALSDPVSARGLGTLADVADDGVLPAALADARSSWPDVEITGSDPWAHAERALIEASEGAHLVVVGSRSVSGLERWILGRSSLAVAMHAACPVVLVPAGARTGAEGDVVVGVDGSEHSALAAERAFWIAQIRKAPVRVITTWSLEIVDGMVVTTPENPAWAQVEGKYRDLAERIIGPLRERCPEVPCEIDVRRGSPAAVLAEASATAGLLVIGRRGRGGFRGMLLGSVAHKVIETATCPVMVVRQG